MKELSSPSKLMSKMMFPQAAEEEEVAEAVVDAAVAKVKEVAEGKMPSKPSRRPRRTSPPYEVTEP